MPGFIGSQRPYLDGEHESSLTVVKVFPYNGGHGNCFHLDTDNGERIVWFSRRKQSIKVGDKFRARFVVQSHQEYNGLSENVVRNVRIL
jgi:hypothetical protein